MDIRKSGINGLTKAGCYYILFGAILAAVLTVVSLFVRFPNVVRHDLLTALAFTLSIVLSVGFYVAIRRFEDPAKMILEFHPPKAHHREEIQRICEEIFKHYNKKYKPVAVFALPLALGLICFGIAKIVLDPWYFLSHFKTIFLNVFIYPALILGIIIFFIWGIVYRNRIDEIKEGAYAVAEVNFAEKYYCVHTSKRSYYLDYFVILSDSYGNKGRFKVSESEYYRFHIDTPIVLVKRSKGKMFYNAMEPVAILLPEVYSPDM